MGKFETRLAELGLVLPVMGVPTANYVPYVISGKLLVMAGQLPVRDGKPAYVGRVGEAISLDDGYQAARLCGINLIAQMKVALGNLDRVEHILRIGGFVNCAADFTDQSKVINGTSDLMVDVFGPAGRHTRCAVGAPSLPMGVSVEVEALVALTD